MTHRLIRAGDAISQFCNVVFLNGEANESISGRCYREGWKRAERFIDAAFSLSEPGHCKNAFDNDLQRSKELVQQYGKGSNNA